MIYRALCFRQTLVFGIRDRQTQTADADADVRIADSDFEISKVLKSFLLYQLYAQGRLTLHLQALKITPPLDPLPP